MQNNNPFYIQPAVPDMAPVIGGLGEIAKQSRQAREGERKKNEMMEAVRSGDPMKIADVSLKYPELSQAAQDAFGMTNKLSGEAAKEAYRNALSDPDNAEMYMQQGIERVRTQGGRPDMMTNDLEMLSNPQTKEQGLKAIKAGYASADPKGYKSLFGEQKDAYKAAELDIKKQGLQLRKLESQLRAEDNELKREKLRLDIDAKQEKLDKGKEAVKSKAKAEIRQQSSLSSAIDSFLGNKDYMNAVTGWRGRMPAVSDTGVEAEAYFDNIKNNLTLENLGKMSGVLSETDIKILSTAASAMTAGMGKKAMETEMRKIQGVLKTKSADIQKRIMNLSDEPVNQDSAALEWAKANPNDPRAVQIMQIQGAR